MLKGLRKNTQKALNMLPKAGKIDLFGNQAERLRARTFHEEIDIICNAVQEIIDTHEPIYTHAQPIKLGYQSNSWRYYEMTQALKKLLGYRYVRVRWHYQNWNGGANILTASYCQSVDSR